jgi:hypothetical protein
MPLNPATGRPVAGPVTDLVDDVLRQLAACDDELVAEWGQALLQRGEPASGSAGPRFSDGEDRRKAKL